jgi:hypothetical protein
MPNCIGLAAVFLWAKLAYRLACFSCCLIRVFRTIWLMIMKSYELLFAILAGRLLSIGLYKCQRVDGLTGHRGRLGGSPCKLGLRQSLTTKNVLEVIVCLQCLKLVTLKIASIALAELILSIHVRFRAVWHHCWKAIVTSLPGDFW